MALTITIAGVDRSSDYGDRSLRIKRALNAIDTCRFDIVDKGQSSRPQEGELVQIDSDGTTVFKGTVDSTDGEDFYEGPNNPVSPGVGTNIYRVSCVDFNKLAERIVVAANYETAGQSLQDIVVDLVNNQSVTGPTLSDEGVTTTGVQEGPGITVAKFNYISLKKAFDDLAAKTGYLWTIDKNKVLQFFDRTTFTAPFGFGVDGVQNHTTMRVKKSRKGYRNVQIVRAGQQITTDDQVETYKGDGEKQTFPTRLPIANDPSTPPTIEVDTGGGFVAKTVGVLSKDDEASFDWFYQRERATVTQQSSASALTSSHTLRVTYKGLFPIVVISEDDEEIEARIAIEGGKGVYMHVESDEDLDDRDLAIDKSEELLNRFGAIPTTITVETHTFGIDEGHLVPVENPGLEISGTYLAEDVSYRDVGAEHLLCRATLIDGEVVGGWVEFFRRVIEGGQSVSIRENEKLTLARKVREVVTLSDSLVDSTDPNDLADPEDDPFTVAMVGRSSLGDEFEHTTQDLLSGDTSSAELTHQYRWASINRDKVTKLDVDTTTTGELHIENTDSEEPADWLDANRLGPFVYRLVIGDFDVFAEVEHGGDEDLLAGILCQSVDTPGAWILAGLGENGGGGGSSHDLIFRYTDDDPTSTNAFSATGGDGRVLVRLKRVGDTFTFYSGVLTGDVPTFDDETAQVLALGDPVRLGIFASRESATGTLSATVSRFVDYNPKVPSAPVGFAMVATHPNEP